jgi:hypothetical protein
LMLFLAPSPMRLMTTPLRVVQYINYIVSMLTASFNNKKFWEELVTYFPLIRHGPHRKRRLQHFFFAERTCLASRCLATSGKNTHTDT